MSAYVQISCDGCDKEARSERVSRTFNSFNGRGYGFGRWHIPSIEEVASQIGWVVFDPYTGCTYCPECWAEIEGSAPSTDAKVST